MEMALWIRIPKDLIEYMNEKGYTTVEFTTRSDFNGDQRWSVSFKHCGIGRKILIDIPLMEEMIETIGLERWIENLKKDVDDYFRRSPRERFDRFISPGTEEWDECLT